MAGVDWPAGTLRLKRIEVRRAWLGALLAAMLIGIGCGVAGLLAGSAHIGQQAANTLTTFGLGETLEGARLEHMSCTRWRSTGRGGGAVHHCDARVAAASGAKTNLDITSSLDLENVEPVRIARIGSRIGIGFPLGTTLLDWLGNLFFFTIFGGMAWFGVGVLRRSVRQLSHARFVRGASIVDVDLLRRQMLDKQRARWDFAFEHGDKRRFATGVIDWPPVLTDGVVTRGAALVSVSGQAKLGTLNFAELELPAAERERLAAQVSQGFHALRPPLRDDYDGLVGLAPHGAERDYVGAYRAAWQAGEVPAINAAIERRHKAALALRPERVDQLLQQCRAMISG